MQQRPQAKVFGSKSRALCFTSEQKLNASENPEKPSATESAVRRGKFNGHSNERSDTTQNTFCDKHRGHFNILTHTYCCFTRKKNKVLKT